jgi:hypothetical protein
VLIALPQYMLHAPLKASSRVACGGEALLQG